MLIVLACLALNRNCCQANIKVQNRQPVSHSAHCPGLQASREVWHNKAVRQEVRKVRKVTKQAFCTHIAY